MAVASGALPQLEGLETVFTSREESLLSITWKRFRRHKLALIGLFVIVGLILIATFGPSITPYQPDITVGGRNDLPSAEHIFGLDDIGRDVLTRLMWAGRISLFIAFIVTLLSEALGVLLGATAGYFGKWVDAAIMRLVDFFLTIPLLPLLLIISAMNVHGALPIAMPAFLKTSFAGFWHVSDDSAEQILILCVILIFFGWTGSARLVRSTILSLKNQEFAEAARALGGSSWRIILRHMIPNTLAPIIVSATLGVGGVIILEAALSFLGFGVQVPAPSWGNMLFNVQNDMFTQPWRAVIPGSAIFLTSLSANFIGDALRDALDPRLKI